MGYGGSGSVWWGAWACDCGGEVYSLACGGIHEFVEDVMRVGICEDCGGDVARGASGCEVFDEFGRLPCSNCCGYDGVGT